MIHHSPMLLAARDATEPPPLPTAPSGLTLTALSGTQIKADWTDNATDEISYSLQWDTDSGFGTATTVALAADAETYTITGLVAGTEYFVRVRCANVTGNSAYTSTASTFTLGSPPERVDSVGGAATATNAFRINWTDVGDEDYFEVAWAPTSDFSGGSYATTTVASGTLFHDQTVLSSGLWYFRVRSVSTTKGSGQWRGYSANSGSGDYEANFGFARLPTSLASPPSVPTSVTATVDSASQLSFGWTNGSGGGFTGNQFQLALDASFESVVNMQEENGTSLSATGLDGNTEYHYRIRSYDNANGDFSAWVTGSATTEPSVVPTAPTGLAVTTTAPTTLDFSWTDPANQQITEVESDIALNATFDAGLQQDASVGVGTEAKQWTGLDEGTLYYTRVRAINAAGNGAYATLSTYTQLAAPTSLAATDNGSFWTLDWTRNSTENDEVEIHKDDGGGYALFDTLTADTQTYAVAKESGAKWKVRNISASAPTSDFSNEFTDPT